MDKKEEKLKQELVKTSKAVKQKYKSLKAGATEEKRLREQTYRPIIEPLKEIIKESKKAAAATSVKDEIKMEKKEPTKQPADLTRRSFGPSFLADEFIAESTPATIEDDDEDIRRDNVTQLTSSNEKVLNEFLDQYHRLPRYYVQKILQDTDKEIDYTLGVHYDPELDSWSLGKTRLYIVGPDILINNVKYKGTPGLYELLFMNKPEDYTDDDSKAYKKIMDQTSLYRRNFEPGSQISGNKGYKYTNIIKPLLETRTPRTTRLKSWAGGDIGGMSYNEKPLEYVYWNEPAELVSRLRLLWASRMAGNTNHNNEIQSIIEELREANIID